jgi:hypothetical protein
MKMLVRLIQDYPQLTNFLIFKRAILDFNGTVMILHFKKWLFLLY